MPRVKRSYSAVLYSVTLMNLGNDQYGKILIEAQ